MNDHFYALIMAGGGGTRLWPLSRRAHPKQSLTLFGERSMFQLAVDRLLPLMPLERIFVVTAAEQVGLLSEQVPGLPLDNFIIEPLGRGTASCIGLSALHLQERDPDAVMAVLTADHFIRDEAKFRAVLQAARSVAESGYLVTLGIEPTFPSTGYGYIGREQPLGEADGFDYYRVSRFTEKPDIETALKFLGEGTYFWNSGMFVWRAGRILSEIQNWMPALSELLADLGRYLGTPDYDAQLLSQWPRLRKETIDYGIMEKADRVVVIPVDLGWSDVGTWSAVMDLHESDAQHNVLLGDVLTVDSNHTMVFSRGERLIATIGVRDLIVVDTPEALLITAHDQSQHVREIVEKLRAEDRKAKL